MDGGENDVCIQITCRFSADNVNKLQYDLNLNNQDDAKQHPVIESQFLYTESDAIDKIFHDTIEELNLSRLYLNGYDVTIVKNGKRNVFYEQYDGNATLKTEKSSTTTSSTGSTSTAESDGSDDEGENESSGLVHSFIRTIFEDLVSVKDVHYLFSIGWTEINELNQLLDLLNGNGLVQCFSMLEILETIAVGLKNKNDMNNHNILSIVLEQQWIDNFSGQPMHKLSTVNFCDFKYANDKPTILVEPMNFYAQPFLPPNYMFSPPPVPMNFFSPPPIMPTSPDGVFFNSNAPRFDNANALLIQQNQRLLKNAEILFSKLNFNDIDDDRRKEIQEWMYLKTECDNYMSTSTLGDLPPPPPSYFNNNMMPQMVSLIPPPLIQQQQSSLLPIIEMDENSTGRDEEETNEDNDSESGSYIDMNDQSNNLFQKISDKISNFQEKTDEIVREKSSEYFENNPKVIFSSGSDCKPPVLNAPDNLCDETVDTKISSEQYLATTGRRRSIRENHILSSEELNLIKKAAAATSFEMDSVKESQIESEQQTKLDELRKTLKKYIA